MKYNLRDSSDNFEKGVYTTIYEKVVAKLAAGHGMQQFLNAFREIFNFA